MPPAALARLVHSISDPLSFLLRAVCYCEPSSSTSRLFLLWCWSAYSRAGCVRLSLLIDSLLRLDLGARPRVLLSARPPAASADCGVTFNSVSTLTVPSTRCFRPPTLVRGLTENATTCRLRIGDPIVAHTQNRKPVCDTDRLVWSSLRRLECCSRTRSVLSGLPGDQHQSI